MSSKMYVLMKVWLSLCQNLKLCFLFQVKIWLLQPSSQPYSPVQVNKPQCAANSLIVLNFWNKIFGCLKGEPIQFFFEIAPLCCTQLTPTGVLLKDHSQIWWQMEGIYPQRRFHAENQEDLGVFDDFSKDSCHGGRMLGGCWSRLLLQTSSQVQRRMRRQSCCCCSL